jgi:hypothetical protein
MSDFSVPIKVITIEPHPDEEATAIEVGRIDDYQLVVAKGQFKSGSLVAYIPESAALPEPLVTEMGLEGRLGGPGKNVVKPIKLRKVLSQGLAYKPETAWPDHWVPEYDAAEELGITKYEPPIPAQLQGQVERFQADYTEQRSSYGIETLTYTEINNVKAGNDLQPGEPVVMTEKTHGCLPYEGRVLMPDGSYRLIGELVRNQYRGQVMGMNLEGAITPVQVLDTFTTGSTPNWVNVKFTKQAAGRGGAYGSITLTPDHRVYSPHHVKADPEGYVEAGFLQAGDQVLFRRTEAIISPVEKQVLIGKILGDGSLSFSRKSPAAALEFGHKLEHEAYVDYTASLLGNQCCREKFRRVSGYGSEIVGTGTVASYLVADLFKDWYVGGKKQFPAAAINTLGPIALAIWYMDDGSLGHTDSQEDRAQLSVNDFDEQSVDNLLSSLQRFGIEGVKFESKGWRIRLNADDAETFFILIAPYVPPVMQYKLPVRWRHGNSYYPPQHSYKPAAVWQTVLSTEEVIRNGRQSAVKYDLTTETGNFFAHGILIHNSCHIAGIAKGRRFVSSKGQAGKWLVIKEDPTNLYWRAAIENDLFDKLEEIQEATHEDVAILYGEAYGPKVQDLHYGLKGDQLGYRAFDLKLGSVGYVDWSIFKTLSDILGIPTVPVIYEGPYDKDTMLLHSIGNSTIAGANHIREGIVVKPVKERQDARGRRVIYKSLNPSYLLRKGGTEFQ